jgi:21S rRNA (GM2251-2'-O)-methyltransferase
VQEGLSPKDRKDKAALAAVLDAAAALDVAVQNVSKHELNLLTDNRPHQGLVLDATSLEFETLTQLPEPAEADAAAAPPVWLALDEVTDPQNLGAIMRCAWFLGAAGECTPFSRCWAVLCDWICRGLLVGVCVAGCLLPSPQRIDCHGREG